MKLKISLVILLGLSQTIRSQIEGTDNWTVSEVNEIKAVIRTFYENGGEAPGALRLSFHDCVGNCDGCLNLNNPDNGGLQDTFAEINDLYASVFPIDGKFMRRGDFWNLAGIVAVEFSIIYNNLVCSPYPDCEMPEAEIKFLLGRRDCPTSPDTEDIHTFPNPTHDYDQMMQTMNDIFGFDEQETTAILGAHTLGEMTRQGSGFDGEWMEEDQESLSFNTKYYELMLDDTLSWRQINNFEEDPSVGVDKWQFRGYRGQDLVANMLDADFNLAKRLDIIDEGGESSCQIQDCPDSPMRFLAQLYATDKAQWVQDFVCAYEKMTTTVADPSLLVAPIPDEKTRKPNTRISCATKK